MHKEHGTEFVEEEFQAYFKETDLNGDGVLQWDEWYAKAFQQAMEGDYFDSDEEDDWVKQEEVMIAHASVSYTISYILLSK